jgi:hypothetical protein
MNHTGHWDTVVLSQLVRYLESIRLSSGKDTNVRFLNYVGKALTLWTALSERTPSAITVTTLCVECGATHRMEVPLLPGQIQDGSTMMHEAWCSVDMRNIRRSITPRDGI